MTEGSFVVVEEFLNSVGAKSAIPIFRENAIDDDVLPLLTEEALHDLKLPLGVQLRISNGLKKRFNDSKEGSDTKHGEEGQTEKAKVRKRSRAKHESSDEGDDDEDEEETASKRLLPEEKDSSRSKRRMKAMSAGEDDGEPQRRKPSFFKRWMPTFLVTAAFTPLLVYLAVEITKDAIDGMTNVIFVISAFLVLGVVILLCAMLQSIWWAYLQGTGPVEYFGALCAEKPVLNF